MRQIAEETTHVLIHINGSVLVSVVQIQHLGAGGKHSGRAAVRRLRGEVRWLIRPLCGEMAPCDMLHKSCTDSRFPSSIYLSLSEISLKGN